MKKIILVAAVACAAALSHASAFNWTISSMNKAYVAGTTTTWSGTAYLFDANTYAQSVLLDAAAGSGIDFSKAVATSSVSSGVLSGNSPTATAKAFNYGSDGDNNSFYLVLVDGDSTFVSASVAAAGQQGKTTPVTTSAKNSKNEATEWTTGGTFSAAGWYTAASSVPEPTSGLLVLLGVAGLALRRRRA